MILVLNQQPGIFFCAPERGGRQRTVMNPENRIYKGMWRIHPTKWKTVF